MSPGLREIHVELDEAVMDAYGWSDIPLDHGFHTYRQMERWTVSPGCPGRDSGSPCLKRTIAALPPRRPWRGHRKGQRRAKAASADEEGLF